jgi:hypothetical protein
VNTVVRVSSLGSALLLAAVSLTGCNTSALTKRELIVHFADGTSNSQQLAARTACLHVTPETVPEPLPTNDRFVSDNLNDVRYRIDHANDKEVAQLEDCLHNQPGVIGIDTPDAFN